MKLTQEAVTEIQRTKRMLDLLGPRQRRVIMDGLVNRHGVCRKHLRSIMAGRARQRRRNALGVLERDK